MKEIIHKENLILEEVRLVRSTCPFKHILYNTDFEYDKECAKCKFVNMGYSTSNLWEHSCTWKEYETSLIEQSCIDDEDDGSGSIPFSNYCKSINCYRCGEKVTHHSGMSSISYGDNLTCKKCGLKHRYLKWKNDNNYIFAIPINTERHLK